MTDRNGFPNGTAARLALTLVGVFLLGFVVGCAYGWWAM